MPVCIMYVYLYVYPPPTWTTFCHLFSVFILLNVCQTESTYLDMDTGYEKFRTQNEQNKSYLLYLLVVTKLYPLFKGLLY